MQIYEGKTAFRGIAEGKIKVYRKDQQQIKREHAENTQEELLRFERAKGEALRQLTGLYEKALKEVGEANAAIFEVHQMMLEDPDYVESITNMIRTQKVNAAYAVASTGDNFSQMFSMMDDDYMRERAADIRDISERLVGILAGRTGSQMELTEPVILVADDLAPSETVQLDKDKVLAFVTVHGSSNSHTAILARTMNIPALFRVDIPLDDTVDGKEGIVDGYHGRIYLEPEPRVREELEARQAEERKKQELLWQLKGKENVTLDGRRIEIYANIGSFGDVAAVLQNDAGGIGLFRSEFLYLESEDYPSEEEQFQVYKKVAESMAGRKVIIRTLDIGADKQVGYFQMEPEENPALGYRAIRICLDRPEIFKTQLRAIYRASAYGTVSIMYPMIISVEEVDRIAEIVGEVQEELKQQQIPFGDVEQGIMIETPAAALISDLLAKKVDFFSIGTNDLVQYTLASDRQNPKLEQICDPHHPAILRLIRMIADNAHREGIWVGICGELGADLTLTETFLNMGIDELSVSPGLVLSVRKKVRETKLGEKYN
ncbi:phosphoenolpyruvate--protein phosphotransferase [Diplocloster agilis]|uniref:phosphoenolpyruvate--protein phosphotransferase n=1 Tax=Diplocloster agilis TaxID=2850323 RepID=UPI0008229BD9|nr:phosphoenolpyruvate--protein phosphotransferase [Suonthocola fibrivorans]MCU6732244.1 phosphoenolpyruvate--protein phosphotransferase [Suonthocola fibrivorans]SCI38062.1 Phosphoenolpyruvate-protein phosphotransferase [uncultured Clostridium sp.]